MTQNCPSCYQLHLKCAHHSSYFTLTFSKIQHCFRHTSCSRKNSIECTGLFLLCKIYQYEGDLLEWHTDFTGQVTGPNIFRQSSQDWRNFHLPLPLSTSFLYVETKLSHHNFDKIRKLEYFNPCNFVTKILV